MVAEGVAPGIERGEGIVPELSDRCIRGGALSLGSADPYGTGVVRQLRLEQMIAERARRLAEVELVAMEGAVFASEIAAERPAAHVGPGLLGREKQDEAEAFHETEVIEQMLPLRVIGESIDPIQRLLVRLFHGLTHRLRLRAIEGVGAFDDGGDFFAD